MKDNDTSVIKQDYIVTKSNILLEQKINMTLNEQKLIIALAALVQPGDCEFEEHTFKARELGELFEISPENIYTELPKITKSVISRVVEVPLGLDRKGKTKFKQTGLLKTAQYNTGEGTVTLEFDKSVKPFFLQLKEFYTTYRINSILKANCKYTIHLYELLKRLQLNRNNANIEITIEELRERLFATAKSYNSYSDFRKKVIMPAIAEINELTDIKVSFEPKKQVRSVISLVFSIIQNSSKSTGRQIKSDYDAKELLISKYGVTKVEAAIIAAKDVDTPNDYRKYVEGLIKKQQEQKDKKQLKFNNFESRKYDYDKLEKKLLGWDDK